MDPLDLSPLEGLGLPQNDIVATGLSLAKTAFSFLGVFLVLMIVYGGFLYMTSGGNEEAKKHATATLKNAVLGFLIIMLAPSIVRFVFDAIQNANGT
jgi:cytochrome bd-type quinol oxidase subunit 2